MLTAKGIGGGSSEGLYAWYKWKGTKKIGKATFVLANDANKYPNDGIKDENYYTEIEALEIKEFGDSSWTEIKKIADSGLADKLFSIGDEKTITLTNGEQIVIQVADFNCDTYTAGGTAPITFVMRDCLKTTRQMNSGGTNSGGWKDSAMRAYCNGTLLNLFPADLKNLIKQVNKKGYNGTTTTIQTTADYLWLPAEIEIWGSYPYSAGNGEGSRYSIFKSDANRIKRVNGEPDVWWERSPSRSNSSAFVVIISNGTTTTKSAVGYAGVTVCFCI